MNDDALESKWTTRPITASHNKHHQQVEAIAQGTVIDHIPPHCTLKIAELLAGPEDQVTIGVNFRSRRAGRKGVIKIATKELSGQSLARIALLAPRASINIIRDYDVVEKTVITIPERFTDIARCANPNCVTNHEEWMTEFLVIDTEPLVVQCLHCERLWRGDELAII